MAWRVNFLSTILHLATLFFFYKFLFELTKNKWVSLGSTFILAFSYNFWLHSLIAEVFPLNNFLAVLLLYLSYKRKWSVVAFVFGLGMSNHHTIILLCPALLYWFLVNDRKKLNPKYIIRYALFVILGLLPYLYLFWAANRLPEVAWIYPQNFSDLWRMFTRADYGTLAPMKDYPTLKVAWDFRAAQILNFFYFLLDDFSWLGMGLFVLGLVFLMVKRRKLALFLIFGLFFNFLFLFYASFPFKTNLAVLVLLERFYLLPNIFMSLIMGFSLFFFYGMVRERLRMRLLATFLCFVPGLFLLTSHFFSVSLRDRFLGYDYAKNILTTFEKDALVIIGGDIGSFLTMYLYYVEDFRPDIRLVTLNQFNQGNELRGVKKRFPELILPKDDLWPDSLIEANLDQMSVYVVGSLEDLELVPGTFVFLPAGLGARVYRIGDVLPEQKEVLRENRMMWDQYALPSKKQIDETGVISEKAILGFYGQRLEGLAEWCLSSELIEEGVEYFEKSLFFAPDRYQQGLNSSPLFWKIIIARRPVTSLRL